MAIDQRRKKYLWVFLVFGALSGFLMDYVSTESVDPGIMLSDVIGGVVLWLIFWWLWAREKSKAKQTWR
jgi:hypothetical protein